MLEKLLNTNEPFYTPYTLVVMVAFLGILYLGLSWTDVFMKDGKKAHKKNSPYFYRFGNYCIWFIRCIWALNN